ncbi:MAG: extracellular solute-binding protein, partial [Candidatus Aenigmatarchaeota archaeon]
LVLFWNKDLIYSIGYIEAPKTFEDIQNIIPQLRRSIFEKIEISPIALGTTENIDNYLEIFLILHKLINEENYKSKLAFYKTLDFYTQFADPSSQYYSWNSSMENQINSFSKGQLAMMINFYSKKVEILQKNSRLNFGIAPLPNFSESPKIINYFNCFFFAVPKQGKSKFGWMFLESLDKNYKNFINMLNLVPTKKEFFDKLNEEQKIVFQAILNSDMFLDFDKNNTRSVLKTAIDNWIYKRKEVENLLERSIYKIFKK